jgi:hypothetical protein
MFVSFLSQGILLAFYARLFHSRMIS